MSVPSAIHVAQEPKNMSSSKKNPPPFNSAPARSQATQHQQSPIRLQSRSNTQSPQQNHQSQPICPWSAHTPPFGGWPSPFLRSSHVLSTAPTTPGKLFSFGGYVHSSGHASNDLYVISTQDFSANLLQTSGDVPDPRYAHGAVFTGTTLVVWGGMLRKHQCNDNSLYLLNIASREWTRVVVKGPGPCARYYHTVTLVGSKLFVFGGQNDAGTCFNDMWAFDLDSLSPVWESYELTSGNEKPLPRTAHVSVNTGDRIIIFGGSGPCASNDTWSFNISTRKWTELQCTGSIPPPRAGHAAVLVDDFMYVFGGRASGGTIFSDLSALNLSTHRWTTFQNMGSGPRGRSYHAMASDGTIVFLTGGASSKVTNANDYNESKLMHVLDTKLLIYPKPDSNTVERSEKTTQPVPKLSAGHATQGQPQQPTFSSSDSDVHSEHGTSLFQNATPGELDHPYSLQIACERNRGSDDLPSPLVLPGINDKLRRVPREDGDDEGSMEHHGKLVAPDASSEKGGARMEHERIANLERQLSETLTAQTERDRHIAHLTEKLDELMLRLSRDEHLRTLEQAQSTSQKATSCAAEVNERSQRELAEVHAKLEARESELAAVRSRLTEAQRDLQKATSCATEADERSQRELAEVYARLEESESELAAVRLRLTDAEDGWAKSKIEWSQRDLQKATSHAAEANERSKRVCEQIGEYETKLAEVRAELEEKKSELEAVRLQLTDANGDDGGAKSSAKAEKSSAQNMAGPLNTEEGRVTRGIMDRMRAMEAQIASLRWNEKGFEMMECRNEG